MYIKFCFSELSSKVFFVDKHGCQPQRETLETAVKQSRQQEDESKDCPGCGTLPGHHGTRLPTSVAVSISRSSGDSAADEVRRRQKC